VSDERVIKLLEEIRDLQRLHVENYKEAIRNQQESIQLGKDWQAQAGRRTRNALVWVFVVILIIYSLPYLVRWALRH
jgi:hypothetical protein